jgi:hypothetical protein
MTANGKSVEHFVVCCFVKPNQECFANAQRGRPQIARGPEHVLQQCLIVRSSFLQVEMDDLAAFADIELVGIGCQLERVFSRKFVLARVGYDSWLNFLSPKKLLSPGTGRSTMAMIHPI